MSGATERITLDETTVGLVGGVRVALGSMIRGSYEVAGERREGVIGALALPDRPAEFVGLESVIDVGGQAFEVVAIHKERGKPGWVTLERRGA